MTLERVNYTVCAPTPRAEPRNFTPGMGETFLSGGTHPFCAILDADKENLSSPNAASTPSSGPPADSSNTPREEGLHNSSSMITSLREQWKNRRGVPESRDPVTGRELYTGFTREEIPIRGEHKAAGRLNRRPIMLLRNRDTRCTVDGPVR
jgi:hypothetical protein